MHPNKESFLKKSSFEGQRRQQKTVFGTFIPFFVLLCRFFVLAVLRSFWDVKIRKI